MVLVGKTGAGKSASGNTILGKEAFVEDASPQPVTRVSTKQSTEILGRNVSVIDTPGLYSTSVDEEEMKNEIKNCIRLSVPGPHVFLLVVRLGRFTQEEKSAVEWIQRHFGVEASKYTMVLFTGADQIKRKSVAEFLSPSEELQDLLDSCGRRYHVFNNEDKQNHTQVSELFQKIDKMLIDNGGQHYTNEMYKVAERIIIEEEEEEEEEERKRSSDLKKSLKSIVGLVGAMAVGAIAIAAGVLFVAGAAAKPEVATKTIVTTSIISMTSQTEIENIFNWLDEISFHFFD